MSNEMAESLEMESASKAEEKGWRHEYELLVVGMVRNMIHINENDTIVFLGIAIATWCGWEDFKMWCDGM